MTGRTYYIDPQNGDDTHSGLAADLPWKTHAGRVFAPGDTILFRRGSVCRGGLFAGEGSTEGCITFGAYGEGAKPVFLGSVPADAPDRWIQEQPSVWRYAGVFPSEVCNLVFDGGRSCGHLCWQLSDLRSQGQWYYTALGACSEEQARRCEDGVLYVYSADNPARVYSSIECVLWGERRLAGGRRYVTFEDLEFRNSGVHGYQDCRVEHVTIRRCDFRYIGGAVWSRAQRIRFGNAVEFWDGASDCTVEECTFQDIYDSAVTHQGGETRNIPERLYFRDNLFVDCGLAAYECREPSQEVYFEYNTCINAGGGFSMQGETPPRQSDPYPKPVGYHVFIWLIDPNTQPGPVYIRHNVFCGGYGAAITAIVDPADERHFVIDHNGYWQTGGTPMLQFNRFLEGKTGAESAAIMAATGKFPIRDGGRSYSASEFGRYQAERGHDLHSRVAEPLFVDPSRGDYRQRPESPCLGMGIHTA